MEKLALASAKPVLGLGYQWTATRSLQPLPLRRHSTFPNSRANVRAAAAASSSTRRVSIDAKEKLRAEIFASVSSTSGAGRETSSVGDNPNLAVPPSSSNFGSPLFWIGVGVGLSALFSWLASYLKRYAIQQAMKTMMGQMAPQNSQFGASNFSTGSPFSYPPPSATGSATSPGLPFPFPPPPATGPFASPVTATPTTSASATVDVSATNIEATPTTNVKTDEEVKPEPKRIAFGDVSPEEALPKSPFEKYEDSSTTTFKDVKFAEVITGNGAATAESIGESASNDSQSTRNAGPIMSVEALEKMMEDPTVQQMVYPYLPEEMRNPATFKWMLQNPEYRKQLQDMLTNMGGSAGWDNRMMDTMKNFDLISPEVKQQFDQIGLTPEEVISKIMANPDVAMAFQNPRVQAAIMDCSQNPFNITKYQNDKEVVASVEKKAPLKVMISGAPASGKGTQCELITKKYGLVHIAAGDLLRAEIASGSENGKLAKEYMEKGQLVPDEIVVMMVKDRLSQPDSTHKGWLLDGYPRSSSQANALKEFGFQPDLFILLEVSEDLLVERVVGRRLDPVTGKIYHLKYSPPENEEIGARLTQRFDDTEEKVKLRLTTHHQNVEAVLSMYEDITIKVDGNASKDDVFAQIDSTLGNLLEQKLAAGKAVAQ